MKTSHFLTLAALLPLLFASFGFVQAQTGMKNETWHTKVGNVDFYSIQDAPHEMNSDVLLTDDKAALARLSPIGKAPSGFGAFVVKKGPDAVLIDTGIGGKLPERLRTLGIQPEDVKNILLTHSHGDHVGGLVKDGQKVFPNATLWIDPRELDFWKSKNKAQYEQCVKLYGEPMLLKPDEKTAVVFPEIVAIDLAGHTPGQDGFLIGGKLLLAADLLHNVAVQFARPDISIRYDSDPKKAAEIRRQILKRAADGKLLFVASHLPFPSAGYVETDGDGFRFIPVNGK